MEKETQIVIAVFAIFVVVMILGFAVKQNQVTNFKQCVQAGNPVTNSSPRECRTSDRVFLDNTITIIEDFGSKIVYTASSVSSNASLFEQDCRQRLGIFNICGNICAPNSKICANICVYTCENISTTNALEPQAEKFCMQENVSGVLLCPNFLKVSFNNFIGSNRYCLPNGTTIFCPVIPFSRLTPQCKEFFNITESSPQVCKEVC
jgi:hypothetical protein